MLRGLVTFAWAAASVAASPVANADSVTHTEQLDLAVGENRTLSASDVKNYSEGAPGIAEVKITPDGSQFVIVGRKPGSTTLLLLRKDGREVTWTIHVFPQPVKIVEAELSELIGDTPGIRVRRVGARFFVEGGVTTTPELQRIEHIAALYPGQVESLVVLGGVAADRKINVRVDLFFVQYSKARSLQFGISWPTAVGGPGLGFSNVAVNLLARSVTSATASLAGQTLPGLDIASRNGWAKVLKHATVITGNGAEAEFASGGAQWFSAATGLTSTLREINFGTTLKILPRFDPKTNEVQLQVGADTADLTPPLTPATNLPGQNTSKLSTSVVMKLGQSLVVSGIQSNTQRRATAGLPWLSEIPILGVLFGSISQQDEDVEGAVILVPTVIESVDARGMEQVHRALRDYSEFSGDLSSVQPAFPTPLVPGVRR
ncbi:MAG: pilus assembly protein N-terminal domain-containing protein [Polyangiales bacterium]